eukprot:4623596-Amphidinium_carterae.1
MSCLGFKPHAWEIENLILASSLHELPKVNSSALVGRSWFKATAQFARFRKCLVILPCRMRWLQ